MDKISSYVLSAYSIISTLTNEELLNVGNKSKNGNPIPSFDEELLINLCSEVQEIFKKESNVLELEGDFIIVGDIHGSFHDLLRILKYIIEKKTKVLFLGDYVDRGYFSIECTTILFALKINNPDLIYLIRGNHEFDLICSQYGFKNEILNNSNSPNNDMQYNHSYQNSNSYTYTESLYNAFLQTFSYLPICSIINNTTFCVHGGLSPNLSYINEINQQIKRPIDSFEENKLLADLVWSDPLTHGYALYDENQRGFGCLFSNEAVHNFLKKNSLLRIIRAHQCVHNGCLASFDQKCITVFSASSYGCGFGNSSGILELTQNDDIINPVIFPPITHLQKNDAFYYKVQAFEQKIENIKSFFSLSHPCLMKNESVPRLNKNIKIYNPSMKEKSITSYNSNISSTLLIKPKFVTKSRKSIPNKLNEKSFSRASIIEFNENSKKIDENNKKYNSFDIFELGK